MKTTALTFLLACVLCTDSWEQKIYALPLSAGLSVPLGLQSGIFNWDFLSPVGLFAGLE